MVPNADAYRPRQFPVGIENIKGEKNEIMLRWKY
jgi:hypothetical protein